MSQGEGCLALLFGFVQHLCIIDLNYPTLDVHQESLEMLPLHRTAWKEDVDALEALLEGMICITDQ